MFGGEKVRPFTLNTQYLLTNMSVGVLSCGAVVAVSGIVALKKVK